MIAPITEQPLYITDYKPVYIYNVQDPFLRAVIRYESNFNEKAVNPITKARGILQIMPVMIKEVNKYSDVKYVWSDAFDPVKSIEIWYIIQSVKNPEYHYGKACRLWFGTGIEYTGRTWKNYYNTVMKNM